MSSDKTVSPAKGVTASVMNTGAPKGWGLGSSMGFDGAALGAANRNQDAIASLICSVYMMRGFPQTLDSLLFM